MASVLACIEPVLAEDLSIGVMLHGNRSCLSGSTTGEAEGPGDVTGPAGESFECGEYESVWRFGGELVFAVPVSSRFTVRFEPGFVSHGYQLYVRTQMTVRLDYLQLAVRGRYALVSGGAVRPYLLAGVFGGRRLNDNASVETVGFVVRDPNDPVYIFRSEHWQDWDMGIGGGAGVEIGSGAVRGLAEAIYDRGLVDVYGGRNLDLHTGGFRFAVGLSYAIRRGPSDSD